MDSLRRLKRGFQGSFTRGVWREQSMFLPEEWHSSRGIWPRSGLLEDSFVADIRGALPFGPLSHVEAEFYAKRFGVNPMTVIMVATGQSYRRPKASPEGHPLKLAINAENAAQQRLRYQAQKHRKEVGEAQGWKCRYCQRDLSGKGTSALDHIIPVTKGGTSDLNNLQLLCRRCNIRKSAHVPSDQLTSYMERKVAQDHIFEQCNQVIPPIVNSLIWPDTPETLCPWCDTQSKVIKERHSFPDAVIFQCLDCRRMFRSGGWEDRESFYGSLQDVIRGRWYAMETPRSIVQAAIEGDLKKVQDLVREEAGHLLEVQKRKHHHRQRGGCWCEFGGDDYEVLSRYSQTNPIQLFDPAKG